MEKDAIAHSFSREIELMPNTFLFICPGATPDIVQVRCEHLKIYITQNLDIFQLAGWQFFITLDVDQFPKIHTLITDYWNMTGGHCIPPEG